MDDSTKLLHRQQHQLHRLQYGYALRNSAASTLGGSQTRGLANSGAERRSRHHIDSVSPPRLLVFECSSSTPSAMSILQLSFFTLLYAMNPRPICILDQSPKTTTQSHTNLEGFKTILWIMLSFILLIPFVKVVRLGTNRPLLSPGSTSLASRPCYPERVCCWRAYS